MDFQELALKRRSIRKFKEKEVPRDVLDGILEAGRWAPSGLNLQPWKFIAVDDRQLKARVRAVYDRARDRMGLYKQDSSFIDRGSLVLACCDSSKPVAELSTMLACENMLLQAADSGLGSLIMTAPMDGIGKREFMEILGIESPFDPLALLAFGYADEDPEPKPRKDRGDVISYNRFK
ncbi:MAG: hypothetical protein GF416_05365 [Candidatus Altiarchaeales archaeon]|nr:hypothetical protein [Candidatus Altiarchaeales archaeon]MBD3416546.1 hypothetical protein [Candidatus Altiarchaeales archaeon]